MSNKKHIPVITGIGMVTGLGIGHEINWNRLIKGESCIRKLDFLPNPHIPGRIGGTLPKDFQDVCMKKLPRNFFRRTADFVKLGLLSSRLALEDAAIDIKDIDADRAGIVVGNCVGGLAYLDDLLSRNTSDEKLDDILAFESTAAAKFMQNALSAQIALDIGFRGPNFVVSTACSSGNYALSLAADMIKDGKIDLVIAGGVEHFVCNFTLSSFFNLGALSSFEGDPQLALKPFDRDRNGTVVSDGSALFIVESMEHAKKRNVNPYCRIAGSSITCEAYDIIQPEPTGEKMAYAMKKAIENSSILPNEIDQLQAHGTATPSNDVAETKAIKQVFGKHAYNIPVVSIKGMVGHSIGAAGSLSVATGCLAIKNNKIPKTVNFENLDTECDLDYVKDGPRTINSSYCLCNAFALGGHSSCIVLGKI